MADYETLGTVSAAARKWNITSAGASYILKCLGAKTKTRLEAAREVNRKRAGIKEDCLDTLTEEGSYWIGFLTADGCIYQGTGQKQISICLAEKDKSHLRKFVKFFGGRKPRIIKRKGDRGNEVVARISSDKLVGILSKFGVVERKTKVIGYAGDKCNDYEWAYIRGIIDGDGCLYRDKNGYLRVHVTTGSHKFMKSFSKRMTNLGFNFSIASRGTYWNLVASGQSAENFCSKIYQNCSVHLLRKRKIYDKVVTLRH